MVWAFQSDHRACSFRTPKPSKEFLKCLEHMEHQPSSSQYPWTTATGGRSRHLEGKQSKKTVVEGPESGVKGEEGGKKVEGTKWEMSKEEWRKLRKKQRAQEVRVSTYSLNSNPL